MKNDAKKMVEEFSTNLEKVIASGDARAIEKVILESYEVLDRAVELMRKIFEAQQAGKIVFSVRAGDSFNANLN